MTSPSPAPTGEWCRALLPPQATLQQAIRNLDETGLQIVLVVSPEQVLLGTVTDGDIRRGLLRGLDLASTVDAIMQRDPMVVPPALGRDTVLQLMQANRFHQLPVIEQDRRIVGMHVWDELLAPAPRPNLMIIMAGGQGRRLRPYTETCPKPLLKVSGKPMLEHIIERARAEGFRNFVLAIHYLGDQIEEYFGDGSRWQVQVRYLREKSPLGTAGALGLLEPRPTAPMVVSNGDVLTDIRYDELLDFHRRHSAMATMAVRLHEWQNPFGVIHIKGLDIVGFEEKPVARSHINAGIYVLEPGAIEVLNTGEPCDMPTLFSRLQQRSGRTIVYPMHEPWLDVGHAADLERAEGRFAGKSPEAQ